MSSRKAQREAARQARLAEEEKERKRARQRQRIWLLGGLVAAAAVVVVVLVVISSGGKESPATTASGEAPSGVVEVAQMFGGIPQSGNTLGKPNAPVTLVEYGDLKCPNCRDFSAAVLPTLVQDYIRQGKVKMVFHPQTFVGNNSDPNDSKQAAAMALAAGEQDRFWNFTELFYKNQGPETSDYVTPAYLRKIASGVPGLNGARALKDATSPKIAAQLKRSAQEFQQAGFNATPSFQLGRTGGQLKPLQFSAYDPSQFTGPIDQLLQQG